MKSTTIVSAVALLFGSAQAHITMQNPVPFNELYDTAPMMASGSDFPCKRGASQGYAAKAVANATVGQPIQLSFHGSADHNGGSCQIVLSKDDFSSLSPTSKFKVIYSIMGGCPGLNGAENSYSIPIPSEVPSGSYTMGWTWFNKVGNREMYMNCATMAISGGKGSDADFSSLPDMAVYNIASQNDCKTAETVDVQFPNPGKYVLTGPGFTPGPPTGSCATGGTNSTIAPGNSTGGGSVVAPNGGSSVTGNPGAGAPSATSGAGNTASFDDGQYHPNASGTGKATASVKASSATSAAATTLMATASPTVEAPKAITAISAASPAPNSANGTSGPSSGFIGKTPLPPAAAPSGGSPIPAPATGNACSTDGAIVCSPDGTQFGLCNFGKVQFAAVSAGTRCVDGKVVGRRARKVRSSI